MNKQAGGYKKTCFECSETYDTSDIHRCPYSAKENWKRFINFILIDIVISFLELLMVKYLRRQFYGYMDYISWLLMFLRVINAFIE